jgi:CRP-like cAMP-binding protein
VAELGVGSMFGEMSLLNDEPRSATVMALEDSNLFTLSEEIFHKLLTKRVAVQILLNIAKTMSKRVVDANMKLRESEGR